MRNTSKYPSSFLLACALLLGAMSTANAQISVIVNKDFAQEVNESLIKDIFATVKLSWPDGMKVQVVDQSSSEVGKEFYQRALNKKVTQVRLLWTKLVLSGQANAPVKCADDSEVKKAVAENKNSIGFIATKSLDDSVKEVLKVE
jgi:ABC-type phosphate transport system substrate-binding protein